MPLGLGFSEEEEFLFAKPQAKLAEAGALPGGGVPQQQPVPQPEAPTQAPVEAPQPAAKKPIAGVPQFKDDPIGAIGFLMQQAGAGLQGKETPLQRFRTEARLNRAQELQNFNAGIDMVGKLEKQMRGLDEASRAAMIESVKKNTSLGDVLPPEIFDMLQKGGDTASKIVDSFKGFGEAQKQLLIDAAGGDPAKVPGVMKNKAFMELLTTSRDREHGPSAVAKSKAVQDFIKSVAPEEDLASIIDADTGLLKISNSEFITLNDKLKEVSPGLALSDPELGFALDNPGEMGRLSQDQRDLRVKEQIKASEKASTTSQLDKTIAALNLSPKDAKEARLRHLEKLTGKGDFDRRLDELVRKGDITEKDATKFRKAKIAKDSSGKAFSFSIGDDDTITFTEGTADSVGRAAATKRKQRVLTKQVETVNFVDISNRIEGVLQRNEGAGTRAAKLAKTAVNLRAEVKSGLNIYRRTFAQPSKAFGKLSFDPQNDGSVSRLVDDVEKTVQLDGGETVKFWGKLGNASAEFRSLMLSAAIAGAAAADQRGRGLSDKDLALFMKQVGFDESDPSLITKRLRSVRDTIMSKARREWQAANPELVAKGDQFPGFDAMIAGAPEFMSTSALNRAVDELGKNPNSFGTNEEVTELFAELKRRGGK